MAELKGLNSSSEFINLRSNHLWFRRAFTGPNCTFTLSSPSSSTFVKVEVKDKHSDVDSKVSEDNNKGNPSHMASSSQDNEKRAIKSESSSAELSASKSDKTKEKRKSDQNTNKPFKYEHHNEVAASQVDTNPDNIGKLSYLKKENSKDLISIQYLNQFLDHTDQPR